LLQDEHNFYELFVQFVTKFFFKSNKNSAENIFILSTVFLSPEIAPIISFPEFYRTFY